MINENKNKYVFFILDVCWFKNYAVNYFSLNLKMLMSQFFLVKQVPGRGPERRKPNKAVLCLLIIIMLISYIIKYLLLNY